MRISSFSGEVIDVASYGIAIRDSCCFAEESSSHSDSTVEADTNTDTMPALLKQHNLTLELFPNHSENLESSKKVKVIVDRGCQSRH